MKGKKGSKKIVGEIRHHPISDDPLEIEESKLLVHDFVLMDEKAPEKMERKEVMESIEENVRLGYFEYIDGTEQLPPSKRKLRITEKGIQHVHDLMNDRGNERNVGKM